MIASLLNLSFAFSIGLFAWWTWFLALKDKSTIEYWQENMMIRFRGYKPSPSDTLKNLRVVFGDFEHMYEIFLPSVRNFPINGVIWEEEVVVDDGEKEKLMVEEGV
jgi:hypothetical protein